MTFAGSQPTLRSVQGLEGVVDVHSLLCHDDHLYVVSTGTDEVVRYRLSGESLGRPEVFWKASGERRDTHHLNSIAVHDGRLCVTAFGPKRSELWSSAVDGYIHDITRNARLVDGICHPHTLLSQGGHLYYCESAKGRFCSDSGVVAEVGGYIRGAAWVAPHLVCLALSQGRTVSKSTGLVVANPADPGERAGVCSLVLVDLSSGSVVRRVGLSELNDEIYDVLPLEPPAPRAAKDVPKGWLDAPSADQPTDSAWLHVSGWCDAPGEIIEVVAGVGGRWTKLTFPIDRPDVEHALGVKGVRWSGFAGACWLPPERRGARLAVTVVARYVTDDGSLADWRCTRDVGAGEGAAAAEH